MKYIFSIIINFVIITAFAQSKTIAEHYKTKTFEVAIFPANYIDLIPGERFTPTKLQIDSAEKKLKKELKIVNSGKINQTSSPVIHNNLNRYLRQYFGYTNEFGEKILLINSVWKSRYKKNNQWLTKHIMANDGGSYYWSIKYNVATGEFFDLDVNGYG